MTSAPKWFKPVAWVALLWNVMGCAAFVSDLMLTPEAIAQLSAAQQALYAARPAWSVAATGLAVIGGAVGCIGLIMRKRWALPALALSLFGVLLQDASLYGMSSAAAPIDTTSLVLQTLVLVVAIALLWLARRAVNQGWMT
jgi:hypothetical protein